MADSHETERIVIFAEFFALAPCYGDRELKVRALVKATRELPVELIRAGLYRLSRQSSGGKEAMLADIRRECAWALRERHRSAQGLDPNTGLEWNNGVMDDVLIERWLARANDPVPKMLKAPEVNRQATPEERARGAALLEARLGPLVAQKQLDGRRR